MNENHTIPERVAKKRLGYIDALRGFSMFLVVFGHIATISIDSNTIFTSLFLTFRMPMFFFISGFIGYKAVEYWDFSFFTSRLRTKAFVQLVPLIIFLSLFAFIRGKSLWEYTNNQLGTYWFTFVLFEMFVLYYTLSLISKFTTKWIVELGLLIISALGILYLSLGDRTVPVYKILCLENLFKYFQFFTLGLFCKMYQESFCRMVSNKWFKTLIIPLFVFLFCAVNVEGLNKFLYSILHDVVIRYVGVLMVFMIFYSIKDIFDTESRTVTSLKFVGRRTLDIYLLHFFFLPNLKFIEPFICGNDRILIEFLIYSFFSISVIAMSLSASWIIRRSDTLAYWCFGSKQKR